MIAAGLFIWLTDYEWRMYSDPAISLVITCIIFSSALPLAKSASFILLQGVPSSIPLDRLRSAIAAVPGVLNVHGECRRVRVIARADALCDPRRAARVVAVGVEERGLCPRHDEW